MSWLLLLVVPVALRLYLSVVGSRPPEERAGWTSPSAEMLTMWIGSMAWVFASIALLDDWMDR